MNRQTFHIPFDEELLPVTKLKTGNIDCIYENGNLRRLKIGETEIIRMIYFAVRDESWDTPRYTIENESINIHSKGFDISYTAIHSLNNVSYKTEVKIAGDNGKIVFHVKGEALSSFKRNRIGLCLLHPIKEYTGKNATIQRTDGTVYHGSFPELINPHQPFKEIQKMKCELADDLSVTILFSGDIFETEDQRNWGDASYKTYSTPLTLPFPVQVDEGDTIEQVLTIAITGQDTGVKESVPIEEKKIPFPRLSCERTYGEKLREKDLSLLRELPFSYYRVGLHLSSENWKQELSDAIWEATNLKLKLELVLFFTDDFKNQFSNFCIELTTSKGLVDSLLLLHAAHKATPISLFEFIAAEIKKKEWPVKIGYGTNGSFADLNRNRPAGIFPDFISFALNPQVHVTDSRSIFENLEKQEDLVKTCHSFSGSKIFVSPISFYKPLKKENLPNNGKPMAVDMRLNRTLGALWTLHTIKNLAGAERLCFYQTKGSNGILSETTVQSPLFHVLQSIKNFQPQWIVVGIEDNDRLQNVELENSGGDRLEFTTDSVALF